MSLGCPFAFLVSRLVLDPIREGPDCDLHYVSQLVTSREQCLDETGWYAYLCNED